MELADEGLEVAALEESGGGVGGQRKEKEGGRRGGEMMAFFPDEERRVNDGRGSWRAVGEELGQSCDAYSMATHRPNNDPP